MNTGTFYRSRLTSETAATLRAKIPYGPVHIPHLNTIAEQLHVHPDYAIKIVTGLAILRPSAFPAGHPMLPTLPPPKPPKKKVKTNLSPKNREALYIHQEGRCTYCFRPISYQNATIDHIVPKSKGGQNIIDNLQLTCRECNQYKGPLSDDDWRQQLNRRQKLQYALRNPDHQRRWPKSQRGMKKCPCHIHGCPPGCQGCRLCRHTPSQRPTRIACPLGDTPPTRCDTPADCARARSCIINIK